MTISPTTMRHKFSLVACARWEEQDIGEWIEYHRAIGIDHFYIYSNDDTPTTLFKALTPYIFADTPIVTYRHWPLPGQQPQIYFHFLDNFLSETEWFCFLDIDEFLVFKTTNSIAAFMSKFEFSFDAVYLNWLLYGNNHLVERDEDSVLLAYTRRAKFIDHHTKVITRSSAVDTAYVKQQYGAGVIGFWHFWNDYRFDDSRLTNVLGGSVKDYTKEFPRFAVNSICQPGFSDAAIETAYVAHFQFKSEQDFIRRAKRGGFQISAAWEQMYTDGSYVKVLDRMNEVEDFYLAAFWARHAGGYYNTAALDQVPKSAYVNIALRKPSRQSSRLSGPPAKLPGHLQGHGNDGFITGSHGFHTDMEDNPWWLVDLLDEFVVREVRVYNRTDDPILARRAMTISVEVSITGDSWTQVFAHRGASPFYGVPGGPLRVLLEENVTARYVRIISRTRTYLHLDEVEVYGFLSRRNAA